MNEKFETWAIVELFGHTKIAGKVTEQQIAGGTFLRVDVPDLEGRPCFTRFYGASAVYSITPTTEEIARRAAEVIQVQPITVYGVVLPDPTPLQRGATSGGAGRRLASPTPTQQGGTVGLVPPEAGLLTYEEKPHQEHSSFGDLRDEEHTYDEVEEVPF